MTGQCRFGAKCSRLHPGWGISNVTIASCIFAARHWILMVAWGSAIFAQFPNFFLHVISLLFHLWWECEKHVHVVLLLLDPQNIIPCHLEHEGCIFVNWQLADSQNAHFSANIFLKLKKPFLGEWFASKFSVSQIFFVPHAFITIPQFLASFCNFPDAFECECECELRCDASVSGIHFHFHPSKSIHQISISIHQIHFPPWWLACCTCVTTLGLRLEKWFSMWQKCQRSSIVFKPTELLSHLLKAPHRRCS